MTALSATFGLSSSWRHSLFRIIAAGAALLGLVALGLAPVTSRSASNAIPVSRTEAIALVRATSGDHANDKALGDQAKIINASLPFARDALRSARPFENEGTSLDYRRALLCLTQAVYYEAGMEPAEGRRAVAQVVLNRMRHPAYPKSICGVVYQGAGTRVCQFTFVCDGALYRAPAAAPWREAEAIASQALDGYVEKSVGVSTHYHANYVAPRWAPLLAKIAQIGQHIFYRWPGAWGQPGAFNGHYIGEPRDPLSLRPMKPIDAIATITDQTGNALQSAGPPIPRAENDVGGLLDISKGWNLHIPAPGDSESSAAKLIAAQNDKRAAKPATAAAVGAFVPLASH